MNTRETDSKVTILMPLPLNPSDAQNACASYRPARDRGQTAVPRILRTIQWNPVTNASKYAVNISP